MSNIAVTPDVLMPSGLKRYALLFDKIAVAGMSWAWSADTEISGLSSVDRAEFSYLHTFGFLDDLADVAGAERVAPLWALRGLHQYVHSSDSTAIPAAEMRVCRQIANAMRTESSHNVVPFTVCNYRKVEQILEKGQSVVAAIVINNLPEPSDDTPWEAIFAFRADSDAQRKLARLRVWMNRVATLSVNAHEIEDELRQFLFEYEAALALHRIQPQAGVLETAITAGLGFVENTIKLRFSKAAANLFSFRHRRAALLQSEATAPGREVAYLSLARTEFGKSPAA